MNIFIQLSWHIHITGKQKKIKTALSKCIDYHFPLSFSSIILLHLIFLHLELQKLEIIERQLREYSRIFGNFREYSWIYSRKCVNIREYSRIYSRIFLQFWRITNEYDSRIFANIFICGNPDTKWKNKTTMYKGSQMYFKQIHTLKSFWFVFFSQNVNEIY